MIKITDLKREVKRNLESKHISDLTDMKLRRIKIEDRSERAISTSVNNRIVKVGKTLINPILDTNLSIEDKFKQIEEVVNIGDIKISINEIKNKDEEVIELLKGISRDKIANDKFLKVTITDGVEVLNTYSWLKFQAKKSQEGVFRLRRYGANYFSIASLNKIAGVIYIANSIRNYCINNEEMANIAIIKLAQLYNNYYDETQFKKVQKLAKKLGMGEIRQNPSFFCKSGYSREYVDKKGWICYLDWLKNKNYLPLNSIFSRTRNGLNSIDEVRHPKILAYFINLLIELNEEEVEEAKTIKRLSSDYARSFETKKNIPQKVLEKMENNLFLMNFGYVEFDELIDLEKVEQIEKEWVKINKQIMLPIKKDHSLRFRRLGKHNANGLYFPNAKAVCVDLSSPSSMMHEVMHMIDYTTSSSDNLSSSYKFRGIVEKYRDITNSLVDALPADNGFKSRWNGNGKYNKSYYQNPKEIFARCGEIYIKQILKIDNSLIDGVSSKILYPEDKMLLSLIKNYYKEFIKARNQKEQKFVC